MTNIRRVIKLSKGEVQRRKIVRQNLSKAKELYLTLKLFFAIVDDKDWMDIYVLLFRGAPLKAVDLRGNTPLMISAALGRKAAARVLLAARANPFKVNFNGDTALLLAAANGHTTTVHVLIKGGADLNTQNANKDTALMLSAENNYPDTVEILLDEGADPMLENANGDSALILALRKGNLLCARKIRDFIPRVNAKMLIVAREAVRDLDPSFTEVHNWVTDGMPKEYYYETIRQRPNGFAYT